MKFKKNFSIDHYSFPIYGNGDELSREEVLEIIKYESDIITDTNVSIFIWNGYIIIDQSYDAVKRDHIIKSVREPINIIHNVEVIKGRINNEGKFIEYPEYYWYNKVTDIYVYRISDFAKTFQEWEETESEHFIDTFEFIDTLDIVFSNNRGLLFIKDELVKNKIDITLEWIRQKKYKSSLKS